MVRSVFIVFCVFVLSGCVPYKHEIKAMSQSNFEEFDKFDIKDVKILIRAIEKFELDNGFYPQIEDGRKYVISKTFKKKYITDNSFIDDFSYENHQNFYKIMGREGVFLAPHTDHRYFNLLGAIIQFPTLGMVRCYETWNTDHYCQYNLDQGRLIYYGGNTTQIPPSEIHLNKSEQKLGITQEQKLQEILACNSQIFLPQEKQINTDKCYRGWYNEIIEN